MRDIDVDEEITLDYGEEHPLVKRILRARALERLVDDDQPDPIPPAPPRREVYSDPLEIFNEGFGRDIALARAELQREPTPPPCAQPALTQAPEPPRDSSRVESAIASVAAHVVYDLTMADEHPDEHAGRGGGDDLDGAGHDRDAEHPFALTAEAGGGHNITNWAMYLFNNPMDIRLIVREHAATQSLYEWMERKGNPTGANITPGQRAVANAWRDVRRLTCGDGSFAVARCIRHDLPLRAKNIRFGFQLPGDGTPYEGAPVTLEACTRHTAALGAALAWPVFTATHKHKVDPGVPSKLRQEFNIFAPPNRTRVIQKDDD